MARIRSRKEKGISIVEALLSIALFALLVAAFVGTWIYGQEAAAMAGSSNQATYLAEEGLEAVRNIRDESFVNLVDGTYGLAISGGRWIFSGSSDATGIFTRQVTISPVDENTKKVAVSVSWQRNLRRTGTVSAETYFTNWRSPSGISCNWAHLNLKDSYNSASNASSAVRVASMGADVFLVYSDGSPNLVSIDAGSFPAAPSDSLNLVPSLTNIFISGNYAYLSGTDNSAELQIVDISDPSALSLVGTFDAPGNADATGVSVSGDTAYLVRSGSANDEFITINVADKAAPVLLGSANIGGSGAGANEIYLSGSHAFVASPDNALEMKVVNITSASSPQYDPAWGYDAPGTNDGLSVTGSGDKVFLGTTSGVTFILDISDPTSVSLLGTYASAAAVNDIAMGDGNEKILQAASASTNREFEAVNVSDPTAPGAIGGFEWPKSLSGVSFAQNSCIIYLAAASDSADAELLILEPGTDTVAPAAVTDLATAGPTADSIGITWTAPGNDLNIGTAASYDIRYSTAPITEANWGSASQVTGEPSPQAPGSPEAFQVTGLEPDTTYYFALKTADSIPNISALSNVTSGKTLDGIPPAAVSDLSASNPGSFSADLSWTAPGDDGNSGTAASYDIRYSTAPITEANWGSAFQVTGEPSPAASGTSQSMTVSGLSPSTVYYFAIKAADESANISPLSNVPSLMTSAGPDLAPPSPINDLALSGASGKSILLSWTAPGDDGNSGTAASYDIRYSTAPITEANWGSASQVTGEPSPAASGTSQSMRVTGLSWNTTYYFAFKTADEVPNISSISNVPSLATRTQASYLIINTATARSNAPTDNSQIINVAVQSSATDPAEALTLNRMAVTWSGNNSRRVNTVRISGTNYWTGTATKGTILTLTPPFSMAPSAVYPISYVDYNGSMVGVSGNVWTFYLSDGSSLASPSFTITQ